ncbi:hypothetical protein GXM_03103 [Nostoc sphaeroides CCNUC1]|uniref:Uncharacterized protein n=1 Tax=Nostoc sphaeroides CCNUC1 TaxID=2653204 RepID=A0A5P8W024_9NOSO|nr:hypothetical protein GXM_03103 [Nostoc sphaeroides CCNUC1]
MIIASTCCGLIIAIPEKTYFSIINRYGAMAVPSSGFGNARDKRTSEVDF